MTIAAPIRSILPALGLVLAFVSAPSTAAAQGKDFIEDAKLFVRVVACTGDAPLPPNIPADDVEAHCTIYRRWMKQYERIYAQSAKEFLRKIVPSDLPTTVVYPFGGGDVISALTTYPDLREVTTMSLERAGDLRRLAKIAPEEVAPSLLRIRQTSAGLLLMNDSRTDNLQKVQRGEIAGQIAFFMVGLTVHGFEPVSVKYFRLNPDGTVRYLEQADLDAADKEQGTAQKLHKAWVQPDFSEAFSFVEVKFRPRGNLDPKAVRTHRHFGFNLDDEHFKGSPLQKHLEAKGEVVAMTKAASYLLWRSFFSGVRDYLLDHMLYMVSDSTGIPPEFAKAKGFEQLTWGGFQESFLGANANMNEDFRKLWRSNPRRELPFRYGYLDKGHRYHLLITRPAKKRS